MVSDIERGNYFVSQSVPHLFDLLRVFLYNRVDSTDFYYNWNHFVSFSLFITNLNKIRYLMMLNQSQISTSIYKYLLSLILQHWAQLHNILNGLTISKI